MPSPSGKSPLRTARDVLSRCHHDENLGDLIIMGYMDRIHGPLEKTVRDYVPAGQGGDIPEHRILYFRNKTEVLWDRAGRIDRIFGSGAGKHAPTSQETLNAVKDAQLNMKRIELEKEEKRRQKAKLRARSAKKRVLMQKTQHLGTSTQSLPINGRSTKQSARFQWLKAPWFIYRDGMWVEGSNSTLDKSAESFDEKSLDDLVVVTWNVLFDLFDNGEDSCLSGTTTNERWAILCDTLRDANADVISLQEVTPRFIRLLTSQEWVQTNYATSASPTDSGVCSVDPHGVCLLWSCSTLQPHKRMGLFTCLDAGRNRSMMATLTYNQADTLSVAAVHLPADKAIDAKPTTSSAERRSKQSRALARKRELAAILGHMDRTCIGVLRDSKSSNNESWTPILAGDFNSEDDELVLDKHFVSSSGAQGTYRDAWAISGDDPFGYTFDPVANARAARSSQLVGSASLPRRIDRVFVGPLVSGSRAPSCHRELRPAFATLLGVGVALPPSDHFGVLATLQLESSESSFLQPSFWSRNAAPSPHYMLALALENPRLQAIKGKYDPESSLPLLHLTLLHGFVEADFGCVDLVRSCVEEALATAARAVRAPHRWMFSCATNCLEVFEHKESATIVARPGLSVDSGKWLSILYETLRESFPLCVEQEKHSSTGWTPHVTLGVTGSSTSARALIQSWADDISSWDNGGNGEQIKIVSCDILKRCETGKFGSVASLPLVGRSTTETMSISHFLADSGLSAFQRFDSQASVVLSKVQRACSQAMERTTYATSSLQVKGSLQLKASLPGRSDIDAAIEVRANGGSETRSAALRLVRHGNILQKIVSHLKMENPLVNSRFRPAGDLGTILTIRLPDLPALDLFAYAVGNDGEVLDTDSQNALDTVRDGGLILDFISQAGGNELVANYQGALRILKLWANHRGVYGASTGFLGGCSWAVWLASVVLSEAEGVSSRTTVMGSHEIVRCFFRRASNVAWGHVVAIQRTSDNPLEPVARCRAISIMAPSCNQTDLTSRSTPSTWTTILKELRNADLLVNSCDLASAIIVPPETTSTFLSASSGGVVLMDVKFQENRSFNGDMGGRRRGEIKAWGSQQCLSVLVELEKLVDGSLDGELFRPRANPIRRLLDDGTVHFCWMIGIQDPSVASLHSSSSSAAMTGLAVESIGSNICLTEETKLRFEGGTSSSPTAAVQCGLRFLSRDRAIAEYS